MQVVLSFLWKKKLNITPTQMFYSAWHEVQLILFSNNLSLLIFALKKMEK